jgi:hypothetical protein
MNNKTNLNSDSHKRAKQLFSKQEAELNIKAASFVKITPQAKDKLEKIPNRIGPYECKLCKVIYSSAFDLASHNCPYIFHCEYKCSECDKVFNSPANLGNFILRYKLLLFFCLVLSNLFFDKKSLT